MSNAVELVLNKLRSALGTGESPAGSNNNFIVQWYNRFVEAIGRGPWCQMQVTWGFFTALTVKLVRGRAYTVWAAQDFQQGYLGGSWHWGTAGMRAGDVVFYDWHGAKGNVAYVDHVGVVERVVGNGTFYVLEGNIGNRSQRMLRDSKYVVGYGRPDWSRVPSSGAPKPKPTATVKPKVDRTKTKRLQAVLEVTQDGLWGKDTDARALRLRAAARAHAGWPRNVKVSFNIKDAQKVIDTPADGIWGPNSQRALVAWVKTCQRALGVSADGQWGPATDNAFLTLRKNNLNKF